MVRTGLDGKEIVRLILETDEDLEELRKLDEQGKLDARHSFGDDPAAWARPVGPKGLAPLRRRSRRSD